MCRSIICIQNWVPHLSYAFCHEISSSSSLCLSFSHWYLLSVRLLRAWNPWYLFLILIFFLIPYPIHQQIGLNFLIMLYTKPYQFSTSFASILAQTISNPCLSIEQSFNIPTLQPVINWTARLTLLKDVPDHVSPLLQTFHELPILPTMKTRYLQWFVSSVHVVVLDYLFELTSY